MKNKTIIAIFIISILFIISIYSVNTFKTYNFVKAIYGIISLSEKTPTYALKDNIILIKNDFKETYINYLTEIYNQKKWNLNNNEEDIYLYCNDNFCDKYKMFSTNFLSKKYTILIAEFET